MKINALSFEPLATMLMLGSHFKIVNDSLRSCMRLL